MKLRHLTLVLLPVLVLLAAGCGGGGGSKSVPADAVAVVGNETITKADFNSLLEGAKRTYAARKTPFPKPGTQQYKSLQDQAMQYLVQKAELDQKSKELDVTVSSKDIDARIEQDKQQCCGGKEAEFQKQLKQYGLTLNQLRDDARVQILSEKIYNKVTSSVKVSDAEITKYYNEHKSDYAQAESRDVRHILVNNKKLADQIEQQLKSGGNFALLAKKYSKDPGSAANGGKLTVSKGQTVPEFDKEAFLLKVNEISPPVHTQYGWHIIQALSAIKPAKQTPLKDVKDSIRQQLLQQKKTTVINKFSDDLKAEFKPKTRYQAGYEPTQTTTASTDTNATTTG